MIDWLVDYPESFFCFLAVLFCLFQTAYLKKDFFRPTNIYVFVQCLALGISFLKLDSVMSDFKSLTWMVWGGGMFAFIMGSFVFYLVAPRNGLISSERELWANNYIREHYNWRLHFAFSLFLLLLFLIGVAGIVAKVGTLIIFSDNAKKYLGFDSNLGIFDEFRVLSSLGLLMFVISAFHKANPFKKIRYFSYAMLGFIPILSLLAFPARNILLMNCCFILFGWNFFKKKIPIKVILIAMTLAVVFFVAIASIRSQYGEGTTLQGLASKYMIMLPYRYIANNYWNLDFILNQGSDTPEQVRSYGLDMLGYMFHYTAVTNSIRESLGWASMFSSTVMKAQGYNTVMYLWEVYKEWGMAGVLMFPFILSFLMEWLYHKKSVSGNIVYSAIYILSLYEVGMLFFCNGFKFPNYWLWLYILMFTGIAFRKKSKKSTTGNALPSNELIENAHETLEPNKVT